ncbi:hypothetical protein SLS63_011498 [Diaporthe eres]|uniref:G-protein coupled receptors family 2 profile 2 domain-containing protein n=1 Tax=Diaporthe eres TaxID=83184 RepID=A0ABR1NTY3_DIAER
MPADAFWILAMAINVYLTFYAKFDGQKLRKMEIPYLLFCYGVPFVVALVELNYTSHYEPETNPANDAFSVKTTEVSVTSEIVTTTQETSIDLSPLGRAHHDSSAASPSKPSAYSVSISADGPKGAAGATMAPAAASGRGNENTTQRSGRRKATHDANSAAWSYTKCSILFFTAILITWIPSTANRVYGVVQPDGVSLPLEYMSAFVLPLQGFWNAVIYMVTSWKACKTLMDDIRYSFKGGRKTDVPSRLTSRSRMGGRRDNMSVPGRSGTFEMRSKGRNLRMMSDSTSSTESTEELRYGVV